MSKNGTRKTQGYGVKNGRTTVKVKYVLKTILHFSALYLHVDKLDPYGWMMWIISRLFFF